MDIFDRNRNKATRYSAFDEIIHSSVERFKMMTFGSEMLGQSSITVLARGRGLAKLIEGLSEGDPIAWGVVGVLVVVLGVSYFVRKKSAKNSEPDQEK